MLDAPYSPETGASHGNLPASLRPGAKSMPRHWRAEG